MVALGLLGATSGVAAGEPAVGSVGTNTLVTFDTTAPGTFTSTKPITGLQPGERVAGIDFHWIPNPSFLSPPRLLAIGIVDGGTDTVRTYTLDPGTGVATQIPGSVPFIVTDGGAYDIDLNPTTDRIRVVNDGDENFRVRRCESAFCHRYADHGQARQEEAEEAEEAIDTAGPTNRFLKPRTERHSHAPLG